MAQILVRVDDDVAKQIRRIVREKYGGRRGALSVRRRSAKAGCFSPGADFCIRTAGGD